MLKEPRSQAPTGILSIDTVNFPLQGLLQEFIDGGPVWVHCSPDCVKKINLHEREVFGRSEISENVIDQS